MNQNTNQKDKKSVNYVPGLKCKLCYRLYSLSISGTTAIGPFWAAFTYKTGERLQASSLSFPCFQGKWYIADNKIPRQPVTAGGTQ